MTRKLSLAILALAAIVLTTAPLSADAPRVVMGKSVKHDTSEPLRDLAVEAPVPTGLNLEIPIRQRPGAPSSAIATLPPPIAEYHSSAKSWGPRSWIRSG